VITLTSGLYAFVAQKAGVDASNIETMANLIHDGNTETEVQTALRALVHGHDASNMIQLLNKALRSAPRSEEMLQAGGHDTRTAPDGTLLVFIPEANTWMAATVAARLGWA